MNSSNTPIFLNPKTENPNVSKLQSAKLLFFFGGSPLQQQLDGQYVNPRVGKNKQNFTWSAHFAYAWHQRDKRNPKPSAVTKAPNAQRTHNWTIPVRTQRRRRLTRENRAWKVRFETKNYWSEGVGGLLRGPIEAAWVNFCARGYHLICVAGPRTDLRVGRGTFHPDYFLRMMPSPCNKM